MNFTSYIMEAGGEQIRVTGATPQDEVFTHTRIGTINISEIWKDLKAERLEAIAFSSDIDAACVRSLGCIDIDPHVMNTMTPDRMKVPALLVRFGDGTSNFVDGSHRVLKRHQMGLKAFDGYLIEEADLLGYFVTMEERSGADWKPLSSYDLLDRLMGSFPARDESGNIILPKVRTA